MVWDSDSVLVFIYRLGYVYGLDVVTTYPANAIKDTTTRGGGGVVFYYGTRFAKTPG